MAASKQNAYLDYYTEEVLYQLVRQSSLIGKQEQWVQAMKSANNDVLTKEENILR